MLCLLLGLFEYREGICESRIFTPLVVTGQKTPWSSLLGGHLNSVPQHSGMVPY